MNSPKLAGSCLATINIFSVSPNPNLSRRHITGNNRQGTHQEYPPRQSCPCRIPSRRSCSKRRHEYHRTSCHRIPNKRGCFHSSSPNNLSRLSPLNKPKFHRRTRCSSLRLWSASSTGQWRRRFARSPRRALKRAQGRCSWQ